MSSLTNKIMAQAMMVMATSGSATGTPNRSDGKLGEGHNNGLPLLRTGKKYKPNGSKECERRRRQLARKKAKENG